MFDFLKRKKKPEDEQQSAAELTPVAETQNTEETSAGFFARLKQGLAKTRASFSTGLSNLFLGKKELDADLLNDIEMALLTADVGVDTTEQLMQSLTQKLARKELNDVDAAFQ